MRLHAANATDLRAFAAMFVATLSAISMLLLVSLALVVPHASLHRPRKRSTASTTPSSTTAGKPSRFSTTSASSNNKYSPMRHSHRLLHQHRHLHGHPLYFDLLNCWTRQPLRHHRRRQHPAAPPGTRSQHLPLALARRGESNRANPAVQRPVRLTQSAKIVPTTRART